MLEIVQDPTASVAKINSDLDKINTWANRWHVTFNAHKTVDLKISNKKSQRPYPPIYLNGVKRAECSHHPNLGLTFTNNLTWDKHIDKLVASHRVTLLHRIKYNLPHSALKKIYTSMI